MRTVVVVVLCLLSCLSNAQRTLDAKVVLRGSKDTLNMKIKVKSHWYNVDQVDERSFLQGVTLIPNKGKKVEIPIFQIGFIGLKDLAGNERSFVAFPEMIKRHDLPSSLLQNETLMVEEMVYGPLSWYRLFDSHGYDLSKVSNDYFVINNQLFQLPMTGRVAFFKKLTLKYPQLRQFIELNGVNNSEDIGELVAKYNSLERKESY